MRMERGTNNGTCIYYFWHLLNAWMWNFLQWEPIHFLSTIFVIIAIAYWSYNFSKHQIPTPRF